MGVTGKYNFPGIQKAMGAAINALMAGTAWGAWILASPFKALLDWAESLAVNYLTNRGLIVLDVAAAIVDGKLDQTKLDQALDDGLNKIKMGRDQITPAQGKAIDDAVRKAFDADADIGAKPGV